MAVRLPAFGLQPGERLQFEILADQPGHVLVLFVMPDHFHRFTLDADGMIAEDAIAQELERGRATQPPEAAPVREALPAVES
jgi:hypothetical protein